MVGRVIPTANARSAAVAPARMASTAPVNVHPNPSLGSLAQSAATGGGVSTSLSALAQEPRLIGTFYDPLDPNSGNAYFSAYQNPQTGAYSFQPAQYSGSAAMIWPYGDPYTGFMGGNLPGGITTPGGSGVGVPGAGGLGSIGGYAPGSAGSIGLGNPGALSGGFSPGALSGGFSPGNVGSPTGITSAPTGFNLGNAPPGITLGDIAAAISALGSDLGFATTAPAAGVVGPSTGFFGSSPAGVIGPTTSGYGLSPGEGEDDSGDSTGGLAP